MKKTDPDGFDAMMSHVDAWSEEYSTPFLSGLDWDHFYLIAQRRGESTPASADRMQKRCARDAVEVVELLLHRNPQRDPLDICVVAYEMIILWIRLHSFHAARRGALRDAKRLHTFMQVVGQLIQHLTKRVDILITSLEESVLESQRNDD